MKATPRHQQQQRPRAAIYARQSQKSDRSMDEQLQIGRDRCADEGWTNVGEYKDGGSASRHSRKVRDDWARLLAAVESGSIDIIWLWESSRGDRKLWTWAKFLEDCRERGVKVCIESHDGHVYDLQVPREKKVLDDDGSDNQYESEKTSLRVRRDTLRAAKEGQPHGRIPYGYCREYEQGIRNGRTVTVIKGQFPEDAEKVIVKEIIESVARGDSLRAVRDRLNERGETTRAGNPWTVNSVRGIALNPVYIGKRVHVPGRRAGGRQGIPDDAKLYDASWPPLVDDEEKFWAAHRVLTDLKRLTWRPGGVKHLLSGIAECGKCGTPLGTRNEKRLGGEPMYVCRGGQCVSIPKADLDDLVMEVLQGVLAEKSGCWYPDAQVDGGQALAEAIAARDKAEKDYDMLTGARDAGQIDMETFLRLVPGEIARRNAARARVAELQVHPALKELKELMGEYPELAVAEVLAKLPLPAQRAVVRLLVRVYVDQAPVRGRRVPAAQRVRIEPAPGNAA